MAESGTRGQLRLERPANTLDPPAVQYDTTALYNRVRESATASAVRLHQNRDDADDIAAAVAYTVVERVRQHQVSFATERALENYVMYAVHNRVADAAAAMAVRRKHEDQFARENEYDHQDRSCTNVQAEANELVQSVHVAVNKLDGQPQTYVTAFYRDGKSRKETAKERGVTRKAVDSGMQRGLAALAPLLEAHAPDASRPSGKEKR